MGVFQELKRSLKKTKTMNNLIKNIQYTGDCSNKNEKEQALKEFYRCICDDYVLASVIKNYNLTYEEFTNIFERYLALGYNKWEGANYLPVSLFAFYKPLEYIAQNKEAFGPNSSIDIGRICYSSKLILKGEEPMK